MTENNKYINSKIYTIRCKENPEFIYVGSTYQPLCRRWVNHKSNSKQFPDRKLYKLILENGGFDNFYIELEENVKCNNREVLLKREGELIREKSNLSLNTSMAGSKMGKSQKEYDDYRKNTQHRIEYLKNYKEKNQDIMRDRDRQYRETHKQQIKERYNPEYKKEYYNKNLETYKARSKEIMTCECGSIITKCKISRHIKSQKHIDLMNNINI